MGSEVKYFLRNFLYGTKCNRTRHLPHELIKSAKLNQKLINLA